jgi:outer membrane protein
VRTAALALALSLGTALSAVPSVAQAETKIAVVDVRRAVMETEEGLRVAASLKQLFDSRQVELADREKQLMGEKEQLDRDAKAGKVPQAQLQKQYAEWEKAVSEVQKLLYEYEREMQVKQRELTDPILQKILGLVRRIASQEGFEMVLEKSAVPYFRADLDITDRAIQLYNGGEGAAPPAKAPAKAPAKK